MPTKSKDFYSETFKGSGQFFKRSGDSIFVYTEGINELAINESAQWLIDYIRSFEVAKTGEEAAVRQEHFQVFTLKKNPDQSLNVAVSDGNGNEVFNKEIPYSDFPFEEFSVWCIKQVNEYGEDEHGNEIEKSYNRIILLPSEY